MVDEKIEELNERVDELKERVSGLERRMEEEWREERDRYVSILFLFFFWVCEDLFTNDSAIFSLGMMSLRAS